jgi:hypothetical protein
MAGLLASVVAMSTTTGHPAIQAVRQLAKRQPLVVLTPPEIAGRRELTDATTRQAGRRQMPAPVIE